MEGDETDGIYVPKKICDDGSNSWEGLMKAQNGDLMLNHDLWVRIVDDDDAGYLTSVPEKKIFNIWEV